MPAAVPRQHTATIAQLNESAHDIVKRIDRLQLGLTRLTSTEQASPDVHFMVDQLAEWIIATARRAQMAARTPAGLALIALVALEDELVPTDWSST